MSVNLKSIRFIYLSLFIYFNLLPIKSARPHEGFHNNNYCSQVLGLSKLAAIILLLFRILKLQYSGVVLVENLAWNF